MEYEVVSVKVPMGMFSEGYELVFLESQKDKLERDCLLAVVRHPASPLKDNFVCLLVARPKLLKPAWNPPKLKKGWVTWDRAGEWCWWDRKPKHSNASKWHTLERGVKVEAITGVMAEFLGCPDCSGFDERNCIWEVGE